MAEEVKAGLFLVVSIACRQGVVRKGVQEDGFSLEYLIAAGEA